MALADREDKLGFAPDAQPLERRKRRMSRREALAKVSAAALGGGAVVMGVGGYLISQATPPTRPEDLRRITETTTQTVERIVTQTVTGPSGAQTVTVTTIGEPGPPVVGETADERALNAARELAKTLPAGTRLHVLMMVGGLHQWQPFAGEWTRQTGIPVEFEEFNALLTIEKVFEEATAKSGRWDLFTTFQDIFADAAHAGVAFDIVPLVERYDPEFTSASFCAPVGPTIYSTSVQGRVAGFPLCGDQHNLFMRTDVLLDPQHVEPFERQYSYPLPVNGPETWDQLRDMLEYFDPIVRPQGMRAGWFFRSAFGSSQEFYPRFFQKGGVLFDDGMNPQISSRIGREVAEDMAKFLPYMDPVVLSATFLDEQIFDYVNGKAFATLTFPTVSTLFKTALGDTARVYPFPGTRVGDTLVRCGIIWGALGAFVNQYSQNPELAYLFLQYMHSPVISLEWLTIPGFFVGAWRECHFSSPRHAAQELPGALAPMRENMAIAMPIMGFRRQLDLNFAIGQNLSAFFTGEKDVDTALRDANEEWTKLTEEVGEEQTRSSWETLKRVMPPAIRILHGW